MTRLNFKGLETCFPSYPRVFKTGNINAAVMTGFTHEEYFHGIELQQPLIESKYSGVNK
jgi:hypothetical protein